jgi:capsular exopolysaccharide synthesis family protein
MRARDEIIISNPRGAMARYQPVPAPIVPAAPGLAAPQVRETSILRAVLRHFWLVILFALVGAGGAYAFIKYTRPLYTSYAKIYIQPQSNMPLMNMTLGSSQRSNYLYTQADFIRSSKIFDMLPPQLAQFKTFEITQGDVQKYLAEELITDVDRKNDIITVAFETPYADEAPQVVAAVIKAYTDYQLLDRNTNASAVINTFKQERDKKEEEKKQIEEKLAQFKARYPTIELAIDKTMLNEYMGLHSQLVTAQIKYLEASTNFGPTHPSVVNAHAMVERLDQMVADTQEQLKRSNLLAAQYQQMVAEVEERRQYIAQADQQIQQLRMAKDAQTIVNDVTVYDPPRVPERPSFPRKTRTMAAAILVGALLGACLALMRDRMDTRMRSVEEIQTLVGLPILGVVPAMSGRRTAIARAMTVHLDPRSVVAEAYRTIRTAVYFGTNDAACKTILVTSPEPGDGKTTSASNLAIAIAQTGRTALLLDADFRKPTQHKNLDIKDSVGLSSVLAGRETLERAIQSTGVEGLDILPCGPIPGNPSEILNSREFGELIDALAARYDHIIFDSPPVNAVTDARILGAVCDATILVMRADKSTRKAGEHARNALMAVGARILGAIVNDAPNRKGYEVYGGSYYGSVDVRSRHADRPQPAVTPVRRISPASNSLNEEAVG